jgi:hypothetical protein
MKREDIEKLLGGYATGTLTNEERRALFDAALTDQALFDALAREEALREVLDDPRCRRQIEQALRQRPAGLVERAAGWMRRPRAWALAGTLAATAAIAVVVVRVNQQPGRVEFQLAQRQKVEAPAPAQPVEPESRIEDRPAAPERRQAAPEKKKQAPEPGGTVGGVIGGIVAPQPPAAPPAEPRLMAEAREPAVPPPQPPPAEQPAPSPESPTRADAARDVSGAAGGMGPVQFQANRLEKPRGRSLSAAAPAVAQIGYDILVKVADGQFVEADRGAPVPAGTPVRLVLTPNQGGNLSVLNGAQRLLFSTPAVAGVRYTFDPPPADRRFTVVLAPVSARTSVNTALRQSAEEERKPAGGRVIAVIDLDRPQN